MAGFPAGTSYNWMHSNFLHRGMPTVLLPGKSVSTDNIEILDRTRFLDTISANLRPFDTKTASIHFAGNSTDSYLLRVGPKENSNRTAPPTLEKI